VSSLGYGGIETVLMNMYRNIDRTKIQFDFLRTVNKKEYCDDKVISLGARVFQRPMRRHNLIRNMSVLYKMLKENPEIKILHIHCSLPFYAVDTLMAMLFGINVRIVHSHGAPGTSFLRSVCRPVLRATSTHWFGISTEAVKSLFGKRSISNKKTRIIKDAFDLEPFRYDPKKRELMRSQLEIGNQFAILHVARMDPVKNQSFLLDAFSGALKKQPDIVLLFAGDGDMHDALLKKTTALGIDSHVRFLGRRDDIPALLQAADLHALPSFSEGLSVSVIEAQTAGLPCLVSDTVTRECKLTEAVEFLPINKGPEIWAERMLAYRTYERCDTLDDVRKAGYDIKDTVKALEEFYLNCI